MSSAPVRQATISVTFADDDQDKTTMWPWRPIPKRGRSTGHGKVDERQRKVKSKSKHVCCSMRGGGGRVVLVCLFAVAVAGAAAVATDRYTAPLVESHSPQGSRHTEHRWIYGTIGSKNHNLLLLPEPLFRCPQGLVHVAFSAQSHCDRNQGKNTAPSLPPSRIPFRRRHRFPFLQLLVPPEFRHRCHGCPIEG